MSQALNGHRAEGGLNKPSICGNFIPNGVVGLADASAKYHDTVKSSMHRANGDLNLIVL